MTPAAGFTRFTRGLHAFNRASLGREEEQNLGKQAFFNGLIFVLLSVIVNFIVCFIVGIRPHYQRDLIGNLGKQNKTTLA